jgi:LCP family protein required for cell wall assembly
VTDFTTKRRSRRGILILRWSVLGLVVLLLATGGYVWYSYQHFVSGISHIGAIAQPTAGSDQNILLVGDDHRPTGATPQTLAQLGTTADGGGLQTDTMMVLHIPANGSKATAISFPRDSWVSIPGFGMNKLNAAFEFGTQNGGGDTGGAKLLMTTIQNMSGLTINHFVRVSLLGFYNIAQALGPIQVCLNHAVNDPYSTLNLPAGVSTLNAQQALAFVRQRHGLPRGDLDREVRQQYFLSVEARKFLSAGTLLNPVALQNALAAVSSSMQTDPGFDFLSLAAQLHGLSANNLTFATIPVSGTPTISVNGTPVSIVQVDTAAMPAFIASVVGTPSGTSTPAASSAYDKAAAAPVGSVRVTAMNGSNANGLAGQATAALAAAGFQTGTPGTTSTHAKTTIEYPPGKEAGAKALAAYVPGAVVTASSNVSGVTLILGTDGLQVTRPGAASSSGAAAAAPAPTPTSPATNFGAATCIN